VEPKYESCLVLSCLVLYEHGPSSYLKPDANGPAQERNRYFVIQTHIQTDRAPQGEVVLHLVYKMHTGRILGCDWTLKNGGIPDIIETFVN
jgi:hypothetical protein